MSRDGVSRRRFLLGGAAGVAGVVGGRLAWESLVTDHVDDVMRTGPDAGASPVAGSSVPTVGRRVLVIVQMSGGNDGLNTLVPAGDGLYFDARPTLKVEEGAVLRLAGTDHYGFNPALAPLVAAWERRELVALEAVGLPGQTRSHFAAMDAWWSGAPGKPSRSGWVGRWLDRTGDPLNPLRAIALGGGSPALTGERSFATVVRDPAAFTLRTPKGASPAQVRDAFVETAAPLAGEATLAAAQASVPAAIDAVDLLAQADAGARSTGDDRAAGPGGGTGARAVVTDLLRTAAGIIDLGLGTQVILVAADGFDTHSDQARRQDALLADVATGIGTFLDTMRQRGRADDVLVLTTSEFGRRVQENGGGTDHGNGNVQFLAGPMVSGGRVVGDADLSKLDQGDLPVGVDTRSLYANALDWLSAGLGPTDDVLAGTFDRLGLVRV